MTETAEQPVAAAEPARPARPRIRFAAVVWGLLIAAAAAAAIWLVVSPARSRAATDWLLGSGGADWTIVAVVLVLGIGVAILIASLLAALRRWQTRHDRHPD